MSSDKITLTSDEKKLIKKIYPLLKDNNKWTEALQLIADSKCDTLHILNFIKYVCGENILVGATYIPDYAFAGCKIKSITIPPFASGIGKFAFKDCLVLEEVTLYIDYLDWINDNIFQGCKKLKNINVISSSIDFELNDLKVDDGNGVVGLKWLDGSSVETVTCLKTGKVIKI